MRCYATPEATCQAVCQACALNATTDPWAAWHELDPATLAGAEPLFCIGCGAPMAC